MNPIKEAIATLMQNQANNTTPLNSTIEAIFSLTKKAFCNLDAKERAAVENFYRSMSETTVTKRPDLVQPFLIFKKTLFPEKPFYLVNPFSACKKMLFFKSSKKTISEKASTKIQEGINTSSGAMKTAYERIDAFVKSKAKDLDLSNLNLTSLPEVLFTEQIFSKANIAGNRIEKLPDELIMKDLCNEALYNTMKELYKEFTKTSLTKSSLIDPLSIVHGYLSNKELQ
jgi:hypothetical protein